MNNDNSIIINIMHWENITETNVPIHAALQVE